MFEKRFKYARVEMERRFLLAGVPAGMHSESGHQQFEDLYFTGTSLRLRRVTSPAGEVVELKLNQKLEHDPPLPSHRIITSLYLEPAEHALLSRLPGARLVKRRYSFSWHGVPFGIDVFGGPLSGLTLAEAEVESEAVLGSLPPLPVAHVEVTADPTFAGGALAVGEPAAILARAAGLLRAHAIVQTRSTRH